MGIVLLTTLVSCLHVHKESVNIAVISYATFLVHFPVFRSLIRLDDAAELPAIAVTSIDVLVYIEDSLFSII